MIVRNPAHAARVLAHQEKLMHIGMTPTELSDSLKAKIAQTVVISGKADQEQLHTLIKALCELGFVEGAIAAANVMLKARKQA